MYYQLAMFISQKWVQKKELKVNLGKVHPTNLINHDPFTTGKYNIEQSWEFMLNKLE